MSQSIETRVAGAAGDDAIRRGDHEQEAEAGEREPERELRRAREIAAAPRRAPAQIAASTGAKRMTTTDSADWNHDVGISHPPTRAVGEVAREEVERRRLLLERGPEDDREDEQHEHDDDARVARRASRPAKKKR